MTIGHVIVFVPAVIIAFAIIIVGIYGHGKRKEIYEQNKQYFGVFKAYIFLTLVLFGVISTFMGISTAIFAEDMGMTPSVGGSILQIVAGLAFFAVGILMAYVTDKKAKADGCTDVVKSMIIAGCGTVWHIELLILKICCFVWLFNYIFRRRRVY